MKDMWRLDEPAHWGPHGAGVYALRCPDGRFYIGKSTDLQARRCAWLTCARASHGSARLHAAFMEHPPETWAFEVLEWCGGQDADTLARAEAHWFDALAPELNSHALDICRWWV